MSPAQAYLLGGYFLREPYRPVQTKNMRKKKGKSKKNSKSKKRSWQNKDNKDCPAWRLLLCPELWPSVLAAGAALFAVLNALHSAAVQQSRHRRQQNAAFWSPEAVRLYEAAAVLITDLPLIREYQLAKIMRNAICWYTRSSCTSRFRRRLPAGLLGIRYPPAKWRSWWIYEAWSGSGEALSSPSALVAFIREGGAVSAPSCQKGALGQICDALSDLDMGVLLCELVGWVIDMVKPNALTSLDSLLQFLQHILRSDDKLSVFLRSGGVNAGVMPFFQTEEPALRGRGVQSSLADVRGHKALAENREALKANKCNVFRPFLWLGHHTVSAVLLVIYATVCAKIVAGTAAALYRRHLVKVHQNPPSLIAGLGTIRRLTPEARRQSASRRERHERSGSKRS
jgi:hypothetical protein